MRAQVGFVALVALTTPATADIVNPGCDGTTRPATVEYTTWLGVGGGVVRSDEPSRWVVGVRGGAALDFDLAQFTNPYRYGGKIDLRWGPWFDLEGRSDKSGSLHGGLALDLGQVRHASFGTYTLRFGGGIDDARRPEATFAFLGGVRYVPGRSRGRGAHCRPRTAYASGGRVFGSVTTDGGGRTIWMLGIEIEPTWAFPPYSLHKLGGVND